MSAHAIGTVYTLSNSLEMEEEMEGRGVCACEREKKTESSGWML